MSQLLTIGSCVVALVAIGGFVSEHQRVSRLESRYAAFRDNALASGDNAEEMATLAQRLARLERIAQLQAQAATQPAPAQPAPANAPAQPAAPVPDNSSELKQLRSEVDAVLTGEAINSEQGKARLKEIIAETQQQQWAERQVRRDERILQRLTEVARISTRQREDLSKALEAERNQRRTLLSNARGGGGNFAELRPAMQELRKQTDEKARSILDASQFEQYNATRTQGRGPRGEGGGQRGQGGGGSDPMRF